VDEAAGTVKRAALEVPFHDVVQMLLMEWTFTLSNVANFVITDVLHYQLVAAHAKEITAVEYGRFWRILDQDIKAMLIY
jgi:hypothetical protein